MSTKLPIIGVTERGDAGLNYYWEKEYERLGCDGVILITKHLSTHFIERARKYNSIVHATITGWGGTSMEPGAPSFTDSMAMFDEAVRMLGKDRVVLRIDPIIPTPDGIVRAKTVYDFLTGAKCTARPEHGTRVRISFMDNYPHVKARFKAAGHREQPGYDFHAPLAERLKIAEYFVGAEICGEPGMTCTGCVSEADLKVLGIETTVTMVGVQRPNCKCLAVKRELLKHRGQCASGCLYCYWK